jgi:hypothetical protein
VPGFGLGRDNFVIIFGGVEPGQGIIDYPDTIIAFFLSAFGNDKKNNETSSCRVLTLL